MRQIRLIQAVALVLGLAILLTGCGAVQLTGELGQSLNGGSRQGSSGGKVGSGSAGSQDNPAGQNGQTGAGSSGGSLPSGDAGGQPGAAPAITLPDLPGDLAALESALGEGSPLVYKIEVVDTPADVDVNTYLDQILAVKGYPGVNEIWLLVFPASRYDLRFVMGALPFEKRLSVGGMVDLVRARYQPRAVAGDPAGGLADLIRAVNQALN